MVLEQTVDGVLLMEMLGGGYFTMGHQLFSVFGEQENLEAPDMQSAAEMCRRGSGHFENTPYFLRVIAIST